MRTRVCRLFAEGDLRIETEEVAPPGPGEVLVRIGAGGICGSDLHYFQHGGFGTIRLREPMILGHEIAGRVLATGPGVAGLAEGTPVALDPSRPCGRCAFCAEGLAQHCTDMRFYGSAMRMPHVQGAFRDLIVAEATQCVPVSEGTSLAEAACAEPLAVCLHARNRAGDLRGRRVLVTGAGPIGALSVAAAAHAGAAEVVATDLEDHALGTARAMGATATVNVGRDPAGLAPWAEGRGRFDVAIECSGAAAALRAALETVRPQGTVLQLGLGGELPLPVNLLVAKEIRLAGAFRFHAEFAEAAGLIDRGEIDVTPILTATFPLERAAEAFALAGDRRRAVKVQLGFAD